MNWLKSLTDSHSTWAVSIALVLVAGGAVGTAYYVSAADTEGRTTPMGASFGSLPGENATGPSTVVLKESGPSHPAGDLYLFVAPAESLDETVSWRSSLTTLETELGVEPERWSALSSVPPNHGVTAGDSVGLNVEPDERIAIVLAPDSDGETVLLQTLEPDVAASSTPSGATTLGSASGQSR